MNHQSFVHELIFNLNGTKYEKQTSEQKLKYYPKTYEPLLSFIRFFALNILFGTRHVIYKIDRLELVILKRLILFD